MPPHPHDSDVDPIVAAKRRLRRLAAARRASLSQSVRAAASLAARDRIMALLKARHVPSGTTVSAYWTMGEELDTMPLLTSLEDAGYQCALPVVTAPRTLLVFRRWCSGEHLFDGAFGTRQPAESAPVLVPEVVLAPLVAFDGACWRLGYGGGFYDRTLRDLRAEGPLLAVGLAFADQEVDHVPHAPWDERLDGVVTEKAHHCRS